MKKKRKKTKRKMKKMIKKIINKKVKIIFLIKPPPYVYENSNILLNKN